MHFVFLPHYVKSSVIFGGGGKVEDNKCVLIFPAVVV